MIFEHFTLVSDNMILFKYAANVAVVVKLTFVKCFAEIIS